MSTSSVEQMYRDFQLLETTIVEAEPSLAVAVNDVYRKAILLAAASEFEAILTKAIVEYAEAATRATSPIANFVRLKALNRQYHTLFQWDKRNANQFFGLFGETFKNHALAAVDTDAALADSIGAFLELGEERNRLVHQNFGQFVLDKTAEEIFASYRRAALFVERIPKLLETCP